MVNPLISVIMPVFNVEKYIREAVDSVLAQTYENWQLVIVDDCSSDSTLAVLDEYRDPRITVYRNEKNRGTSFSRMRAVSEAAGDWVAFLDGDDRWAPEKLQKQVLLMNRVTDPVLLFTGSAFMNDEGKMLDYVMEVPERITYRELLKQNLISCSSVLVRKDMVRRHSFPDIPMIHEDFAVWLGILKEVRYAYGVNEPLLIYRLARNSKSSNKMKAARMNWNTYRYAGVPLPLAAGSMVSYTLRGLKKYSRLK
jgi:glycosyltransferase involved in cell wall biosynthesis